MEVCTHCGHPLTQAPIGPRKVYCSKRCNDLARAKAKKLAGECRQCCNPVRKGSDLCEAHLLANRQRPQKVNKYARLKCRAKERGLPFTFSEAQFNTWIAAQPRACHYCLVEESTLAAIGDKKRRLLTVDRMDNAKGYEPGNLCLACFACNNRKGNFFTHEEWLQISKDYIRPQLEHYHDCCSFHRERNQSLNSVAIAKQCGLEIGAG